MFMGMALFWGDENVLELDRGEVAQPCKYTKCH